MSWYAENIEADFGADSTVQKTGSDYVLAKGERGKAVAIVAGGAVAIGLVAIITSVGMAANRDYERLSRKQRYY
jgi:hypothetical protein